jgi:hypothetical protein
MSLIRWWINSSIHSHSWLDRCLFRSLSQRVRGTLMTVDTICPRGTFVHCFRSGLGTDNQEHHCLLGRLAYNYPCAQATSPLVAAPLAHHLRPRLDRLCLLLVSTSFSSSDLLLTVQCRHEAICLVYATRDRMGNTSGCRRSCVHSISQYQELY